MSPPECFCRPDTLFDYPGLKSFNKGSDDGVLTDRLLSRPLPRLSLALLVGCGRVRTGRALLDPQLDGVAKAIFQGVADLVRLGVDVAREERGRRRERVPGATAAGDTAAAAPFKFAEST